MPVPNNNYDDFVENMLPVKYRLPKMLAYVKSLVSAIKWRYGIFKAYMNGDFSPKWDSAITYATGNKVQYNYRVYESLIDSNTNNAPDQNPDKWFLRNDNFIGATERAKYNGRYINLTYALNRYFGTTFRQPPYPAPYDNNLGGGTFSDIYITNVAPTFASFVSFETETGTSDVFTNGTGNNAVFTTEIYAAATSYTFAIWFPLAVYNALGATDPIRLAVIDGFVSKLLVAGTNYIVETY